MATSTVVAKKTNGPPKPPEIQHVIQDEPISITSPTGFASILVSCCGQLEYTKICLPSIVRHTRKPYEIIFLDIGSLDGTAEYLAGFAVSAQVPAKIVRTATDLGITKAVEDATRQARGEYLVLLNNDTIVTDAWLSQLVGLAKMEDNIGLVGPMSNYAAAPQLVEKVPYRIGPTKSPAATAASGGDWLVDTTAVDDFARQWRDDHKGKWLLADRLGGFCLLVKREVLKRIGHFKETSEMGLFDTDLLCNKARQAHFTLACCKDLFIHHFGTRTFAHGAPAADVVGEHAKP